MKKTIIRIDAELSNRLKFCAALFERKKEEFTEDLLKEALIPYLQKIKTMRFK